MKKYVAAAILFAIMTGLAATASADLNSFLTSLNVQARADLNDFGVKLSAQFGVPLPQVQAIIRSVETPADAFMCLQLGQMTRTEPTRVVQTYKLKGGKGWGAVARSLGIKPGSAQFHALKRGDFAFTGEPGGGGSGKGHGKGKGRGKGHKYE